MPVDTKLNNLVINKLTTAQYQELVENDQVNENELYLTTDNSYPTEQEMNDALSAKQDALVSGTNIKTINNESLLGSGNIDIEASIDKAYFTAEKVKDHLYYVDLNPDQQDLDYATQYFEENYHNSSSDTNDIAGGACSSIRNGNFYGRNYDWYYDNSNTIVLHNQAGNGKYESIGVAYTILTEEEINEGWNEYWKILPYQILDGINEYGVFVNDNVVPTGDKGRTTGTHSDILGEPYYCMTMLPKIILDRFTNATDAVEWLRDYAKVYAPVNEVLDTELHFMIGDFEKTYIVEYIQNECVVTEVTGNKQIMTNFYINNTTYDSSGHIDFSSVTNYGAGLERFNTLVDRYNDIHSLSDMRNAMESIKYTKAYTEIFDLEGNVKSDTWKTEWAHDYSESTILPVPMDLHANSPLSDYITSGIFDIVYDLYENRSRDETPAKTWQTVHSSVYDLTKKYFTLRVQEELTDEYFTFPIKGGYVAGENVEINDNVISAISGDLEIIDFKRDETDTSILKIVPSQSGFTFAKDKVYAIWFSLKQAAVGGVATYIPDDTPISMVDGNGRSINFMMSSYQATTFGDIKLLLRPKENTRTHVITYYGIVPCLINGTTSSPQYNLSLNVLTAYNNVDLDSKQDLLVSGENIKTINGTSVLGSGDITIESTPEIDEKTITLNENNELQVSSVIDKNDSSSLDNLELWSGTQLQWNNGGKTNYWYGWKNINSEKYLTYQSFQFSKPKRAAFSSTQWIFLYIDEFTNHMEYSYIGGSLQNVSFPYDVSLRDIAFGNGRYIVVCDNTDKAYYCSNPYNWFETTLPATASWTCVGYGNGKFLAITDSTIGAYSNDRGITWTEIVLPIESARLGMIYVNDKFVILCENKIIYSSDLETWSIINLPTGSWYSIASSNDKVVISGENKIIYSSDLETWSEATVPSNGKWTCIAYGDDRYVSIDAENGKVAVSLDGIDWRISDEISQSTWYCLAYAERMFVSVGANIDNGYQFQFGFVYTDTETPQIGSDIYYFAGGDPVPDLNVVAIDNDIISLSNGNSCNRDNLRDTVTQDPVGITYPNCISYIKDTQKIMLGSNEIASRNIFEVIIGGTSINDIYDNYNAGKLCYLAYNNHAYMLTSLDSEGAHFSYVQGNNTYGLLFSSSDERWHYEDANNQPLLVSGSNIKTVNSQSILGSGNINVVVSTIYDYGEK